MTCPIDPNFHSQTGLNDSVPEGQRSNSDMVTQLFANESIITRRWAIHFLDRLQQDSTLVNPSFERFPIQRIPFSARMIVDFRCRPSRNPVDRVRKCFCIHPAGPIESKHQVSSSDSGGFEFRDRHSAQHVERGAEKCTWTRFVNDSCKSKPIRNDWGRFSRICCRTP